MVMFDRKANEARGIYQLLSLMYPALKPFLMSLGGGAESDLVMRSMQSYRAYFSAASKTGRKHNNMAINPLSYVLSHTDYYVLGVQICSLISWNSISDPMMLE